MHIPQDPNPAADAPPRHRLLEEIAHEMSRELVFPTSFDTVTRLIGALEDPDIGLAQIAALITVDPLLSARVLALANSAAYNPAGDTVQQLQKAIERLGVENVRVVALAVATRQMMLAHEAAAFRELADRIWTHSLHTASAAYVLARKLTRQHPDEALLAGLLHNIGAFYMIYRGAQFPELTAAPKAMLQLLAEWQNSVGQTLAIALGLPQKLTDTIFRDDEPRDWPDPLISLSDLVYVADLLAGGAASWQQRPLALADEPAAQRQQLLDQWATDIDAHRRALTAAFA